MATGRGAGVGTGSGGAWWRGAAGGAGRLTDTRDEEEGAADGKERPIRDDGLVGAGAEASTEGEEGGADDGGRRVDGSKQVGAHL